MAVLMPIRSPAVHHPVAKTPHPIVPKAVHCHIRRKRAPPESNRGPPLLPGLIAASVCKCTSRCLLHGLAISQQQQSTSTSARVYHTRRCRDMAHLDSILDGPACDTRLDLSMNSAHNACREGVIKAKGVAYCIHLLPHRHVC
jgi:hypothetical protein